MIHISISYHVKWRVFGVTLGISSGHVPFSFLIPGLSLPPGIWLEEPLSEVGRGVKLGIKLEVQARTPHGA